MTGSHLVADLAMAVVAAFLGGIVAQRLGQPVILGYLLAGVLIGPATPGPMADLESVRVLAEIGVAFLMFALGAEVSLGELRRLGKVATVGGALQIGGTMLLGPLLAPALGLAPAQGVFLGALLALSSTVVALKVLMARGELSALHGRVTLGILIAQDLAVVPMVVALPLLAAGGENLAAELGLAALKAVGVLVAAYVLGVRVVPALLNRAAIARSRELFLMGIVGLALGTALVTALAGLSLAFGAFLAGLAVSESEYRTQVVAEVLPLRDVFSSLFFVSVGMLINPVALASQVGAVALVTAVLLVGKVAIAALAVAAVGVSWRVALPAALALAQVGEFSFVLAQVGVEGGAIPPALFDLVLATALISIVLTPALVASGPRLLAALERVPWLGARLAVPIEVDADVAGLNQHAVICGYGRVGRELARALEGRGMHYLVIEYNPTIARELRAHGIPTIYGDASNETVLEHAHLERARLAAVLMPDASAAELATRAARRLNPRLDIVARATDGRHIERLRRAGATDVVQPEFEAGVEVIRHALRRFGVSGAELQHVVGGWRDTFYRHAAEPEPR